MSWTVVFTSTQIHMVEIAKSILDENGIKSVTIDKRDSMYQSVVLPAIELHIQSEDFIRAKQLLSELESE